MPAQIEDYALIGDMQTAALVRRDGTVDWLCLPRFDSPAVFAGLLGTEEHGFWRIGPAHHGGPAPTATRRRYRGDSLVLESEWDTPRGTVRVIDFMPPRHGPLQVIRIVEGVSGTVKVESDFHPKFGYGAVTPLIRSGADRTVALAGAEAVWLDHPAVPVSVAGSDVRAAFTVRAGDRVSLAMIWRSSHAKRPGWSRPGRALAATEGFWREWVAQCTYTGPFRDAVVRSLITLKALTYGPTGGIVAAPTTSLPEDIGGVRNWDYRFTWLRDAAITLSSLLRTGYREEARAWFGWLERAVAGDPENLQIMYGIAGERELDERELHWLPGYEGSFPVRIGNGAAHQFQLDVYGEVSEALDLARVSGLGRSATAIRLQLLLAELVARRWREPDEGIWEVRGPRQHFVHSKVMAWVAVDRTVKLIESGEVDGPLDRLRDLRDEIHHDVCEKGYDRERNTFTQSYGSKELDASLLLIPQMGFLPPDDKRVIGTIEAIQRDLSTSNGFVLRYRTDGAFAGVDGLTGDEGAFLICSFWLVDALVLIGRVDEAEELFARLVSLANDVGLLAEEWDPRRRRQIGNFPQAFSHVGLVNSARLLVRARLLGGAA
jgi:GH15 family glucan-1,4-alpha-glucosidase